MGSKERVVVTSQMQEATTMSDEETRLYAMHLAGGSILPMVVKAVVELGVLDVIAGADPTAALSGPEIAARLPVTSNPGAGVMIDRMLRLMACCSAVTCSLRDTPGGGVERLYGLNPASKFLTKSDHAMSFAPLCLFNLDKVLMESWFHLKEAVLHGGIPFNMAYGMDIHEYRETDPRFDNIFNRAMSENSAITAKKLLETYEGFEGLDTVVHVGGGTGAIISMIVAKYPSIKAINFDLPHVIKHAPVYPGVEHISGDMFVSVPKGDAVFIKWVCHNWSDEQCLKLLKNCYDAVPENGKVIVVESILPVVPDTRPSTERAMRLDVAMLISNPGGKERTEEEFEALAKGAGFKDFRVVCNALYSHVMEFLKI